MELKPKFKMEWKKLQEVLIVPFMELKQDKVGLDILALGGLNRTFYGIETHMALERHEQE